MYVSRCLRMYVWSDVDRQQQELKYYVDLYMDMQTDTQIGQYVGRQVCLYV